MFPFIQNKTADPVVPEKNKLLVSLKDYVTLRGKIQDIANYNNANSNTTTNSSLIIEQILSEALLPQEAAPLHYVRCIYKFGLKETLSGIMSTLAAGVGFKSSYDNARPIIELLHHIYCRPFANTVDENYVHLKEHFQSNCRQVRDKLENECKDKVKSDFDAERKYMMYREVLSATENDSITFIPHNYTDLVLNNFETIGTNTFTYRMLYDVVCLSDPYLYDSAELRLKAADIIAEATKGWDYY